LRQQEFTFVPDMPPVEAMKFHGETYQPALDQKRLGGQMLRVYEAMRSGRRFTLAQLAEIAGGSESGVSARIRDLRKPQYGKHEIERRRVAESGLWEYRMRVI
jgi:hypothetical protein